MKIDWISLLMCMFVSFMVVLLVSLVVDIGWFGNLLIGFTIGFFWGDVTKRPIFVQ